MRSQATHSVWTWSTFFLVMLCLQSLMKSLSKKHQCDVSSKIWLCTISVKSIMNFIMAALIFPPVSAFVWGIYFWLLICHIALWHYKHQTQAWLTSTAVLAMSPLQSVTDKLDLSTLSHTILTSVIKSYIVIETPCMHLSFSGETSSDW